MTGRAYTKGFTYSGKAGFRIRDLTSYMERLADQPPAAAEPSGEDCSKSEAAVYYP